MATALLGTYRTWQRCANGEEIISLLHDLDPSKRGGPLEEVLWNALNRSDALAVRAALLLPAPDSGEDIRLLGWLAHQHQFLAHDWVIDQVLGAIERRSFDGPSVAALRPVADELLVNAPDSESFTTRAKRIVDSVMNPLSQVAHFTSNHGDMMFSVGFPIWNIGEEGTSEPRPARLPGLLQDLKMTFYVRVRTIWWHLFELHDREGVTAFCNSLSRLMQADVDGGITHSLTYDILEDGFAAELLELDALEQLAVGLDVARPRADQPQSDRDERYSDSIDSLVGFLGVLVVELGHEDQVRRILANGGLGSGARMPRRVSTKNKLKASSFEAVARSLGQKDWPDR
ncbi:MAG: hypothetical protein M3077_05765 [Candidatus Dormibacteraeota bacterium]|nr:hypothetical protein [Candidatus Dormibacteraeota bacterium]